MVSGAHGNLLVELFPSLFPFGSKTPVVWDNPTTTSIRSPSSQILPNAQPLQALALVKVVRPLFPFTFLLFFCLQSRRAPLGQAHPN
jgi:hypothetical protein